MLQVIVTGTQTPYAIVVSNNIFVFVYCTFLDPVTGAHTQNIECTWWQIK